MRVFLFVLISAVLSGCAFLPDEGAPLEGGDSIVVKDDHVDAFPISRENFNVDANELVDKFERTGVVTNSTQSKFFANDETVGKILNGEVTNYSLTEFKSNVPNNRYTLAFKVINALKMLGYTLQCDYGYETCLANFSTDAGLPPTTTVTRQVLENLDGQVAGLEQHDASDGRAFPLYNELIEENLAGEPSKNHLAALLQRTFNLVPPHLLGSKDAFSAFFYKQFSGAESQEGVFRCNLENKCVVSFGKMYYTSQQENDTNTVFAVVKNDVGFISTILHEYAHWLDESFYARDDKLKKGVVDTREFYSFTYNLSTEFVPDEINWKYYAPFVNWTGREEEFFVSQYADGWQREEKPGYFTAYEDFAESFTMYLLAGDVFRCKAEKYPLLKRKYDWLRENVFENFEYTYQGYLENCSAFYNHPDDYLVNNDAIAKFSFNNIQMTKK